MLMRNPLLHPSLRRPLPLATLSAATAAAGTAFYLSRTTSTASSSQTNPSPTQATMATTLPPAAITPYTPRHKTWPYHPSDFSRSDSTPDTDFYASPRFVTHIDDSAIASLRRYYSLVLPRRGRILDFCSSWTSHYPAEIEEAVGREEVKVVGLGLNQEELDANKMSGAGRIVMDLNTDPVMPLTVCGERANSGMDGVASGAIPEVKSGLAGQGQGQAQGRGNEGTADTDTDTHGLLDASTCAVSIDYLTAPVSVLSSLLARTKPGGAVHSIVSNRCFPSKAVRRWLQVDEQERSQMVADCLWFAGWRGIEICDLKMGDRETEGEGGGLQGFFKSLGMGGSDPLWAVRAVKE